MAAYDNLSDECALGDKPVDECGIFGIHGVGAGLDVSKLTYYGLYALQHRGQQSAGIAVSNGDSICLQKDMGLVSEVFNHERLVSLSGDLAIGHVRYSTTGSNSPLYAQPLVFHSAQGMLGLAQSGSLVNATELRRRLYDQGAVFQTISDGELIVNLLAQYNRDNLIDAIEKSMSELQGAYSLLILTENKLIGARDPLGIRPLCLGKCGDAYILASESCALDTAGATLIRDIKPGEIVVIDEKGITSRITPPKAGLAHCIFEYIYFARADSCMDGFIINNVRREMGRQLARECPIEADVVISVPDSGITAARGFALESGIPFEEGLMKNRYIGRTFIQPTQNIRDLGVRLKLNPIHNMIQGKRVIIVDDSIVRGTTSGKIVNMLRECGAKEVHFCSSSPPVKKPCYYGIDISEEEELIAYQKPLQEIRKHIGADTLNYLSLEGLLNIFGDKRGHFCTGCFNGEYPAGTPKTTGCSQCNQSTSK